ncbi:MAG TPA: carboxypeptidase-like regulatory domain-containing protein [Polyangia bacterium]
MTIPTSKQACPCRNRARASAGTYAIFFTALAFFALACSPKSDLSDAPAGGAGGTLVSAAGGATSGMGGSTLIIKTSPGSTQCNGSGYSCLVPKCYNAATGTTVSGTVLDPSGKNPVYGAVVYIPDQPDQIGDISQGPGNLCGRCVQPAGSPIAGAVTGADGSFTITRTPVGRQIPIVVQLGKWRRMSFIDINNACADNPIGDPDLTRLPRSRGDGKKASLPRIAIAAGAADRLQCLLLRMGVDASEFTNPDGSGSVNLFNQPPALGSDPSGRYDLGVNSGAAFPDAAAFWSDLTQLAKYDVVLLACAGNQAATDPTRTIPNPITDSAKASLVKYMASGGRVLGEHYNWAWIRSYPPKSDGQASTSVPSPLASDVASWFPYVDAADASSSAVPANTTAQVRVDTSFSKGKDFARWLVAAKATPELGILSLVGDVKRTAIDELAGAPSAQRWLYQPASPADPTGAAAYSHYLSFNLTSSGQVVDRASTDATNLCGRFVYTGLHADVGDTSTHASDLADDKAKAAPFPSCCAAGDLNPTEKAMEFMVLDLSACLTLDADTTADQILF